ncbi:MAG: valine--tRNA ligase [Thiotrichales bacterium SG8_50]|nr:MAG: valine--tRNA ligase [Thiotrichales bacterium SG8_50]
MDKTYDPHAIEQQWYQNWEEKGYFAPAGGDKAFCIMIPPPNVTGSLHMGHGFNNTVMDTLVRYHRMKGDNTLWQPGTDHAGIATQMVVERQLNAENKTRHDLGRDKFIERVWKWKEESGGNITHQLRRMGSSLDWSRERFTMDAGLSEAVKEVFVRLFEEDLIYRGKRLVNWDPILHTAVSDLEVISEEESGHLWHMRYPLTDGSGHLVVATTRPETMLGDSAVAVHPDDERYQHLVGKTVTLPLVGREIPVLADDYVDPEFGTGCVKITPAHDFNDYEVGKRHGLPLINVMTLDAAILETAHWEYYPGTDGEARAEELPARYAGLDRYEARDAIVHDLKDQKLLEKIDDHKLMVPRGDRSGAVVEPFLTDQWYVRIAPLAEPAIKAVEDGSIRFVPDNWKNTYFDWMRNIQDWCISRQIWWGHRIPAWYDESGELYVGRSEAEVREKYNIDADVYLEQDEDVLDTWFSSALWPFSTLGWPQQTDDLKTFYPTDVLITGFDIIFFWVARMIMMGLKFTGEVPFREVYIHGLVRDAEGQKMSKSKGNVLDPIDVIDGIDLESLVKKRTRAVMQPHLAERIEKLTRKNFPDGIPAYGTDALRFTFAALATTGRDISLAPGRIEGSRNFCNKLWNAARYVLMNTEDKDCGQSGGDVALSASDRWILSRLQQVAASVNAALDQYRFDHASQTLYSFVWDEYCSWYLELSKVVLNDESSSDSHQRGTRKTLVQVLEAILRLLHPITPFITEEIWQRVAPLAGVQGDSVMLQPYPTSDDALVDEAAVKEMQWAMEAIDGIRNIRGELDIKPGIRLNMLLQGASQQEQERFAVYEPYINFLGRVDSTEFVDAKADVPESATALVGEAKILVPLAGLIDKDAEIARLTKDIDKSKKELQGIESKLGNKNFVDKAPAAVVEQSKTRQQELETVIDELQEQLKKIEAM